MVLMMHSKVLYKMSTDEHFKEGQEGKIALDHDYSDAVAGMLHYMYNGTPEFTTKDDLHNDPLYPVQLVVVTDKYDVAGLRVWANCKALFVAHGPTAWQSKSVVDALMLMYEAAAATTTLRNVLAFLVARDIGQVTQDGNENFFAALIQVPEFAADVVRALGQKARGE